MSREAIANSDMTAPCKIVCLGWGSLIWDGQGSPVKGTWQTDGPQLPVEFARQSADGRITLVIVKEVPSIPVLWVELEVNTLHQAVSSLAHREHVRKSHDIGRWPNDTARHYEYEKLIVLWARNRCIAGVVWTALPPGMGESRGVMPTLEEIRAHFTRLDDGAHIRASEYVRKVTTQIQTPYRSTLESIIDVQRSDRS